MKKLLVATAILALTLGGCGYQEPPPKRLVELRTTNCNMITMLTQAVIDTGLPPVQAMQHVDPLAPYFNDIYLALTSHDPITQMNLNHKACLARVNAPVGEFQ